MHVIDTTTHILNGCTPVCVIERRRVIQDGRLRDEAYCAGIGWVDTRYLKPYN